MEYIYYKLKLFSFINNYVKNIYNDFYSWI